jgi:hypothetical protein
MLEDPITMKRLSAFTVRALLFVIGAIAVAYCVSVFYPSGVNVKIDPVPAPLRRYDDGGGHIPLLADIRVTNASNKSVWFLGRREMPFHNFQRMVGGEWEYGLSESPTYASSPSRVWTELKSGDSVTFSVGPVSEQVGDMRVGLAFTTEAWFTPSKVHWIFSPIAKLAKRGEEFFWEPVLGSSQVEQVLPLASPTAK